MQKSGAMGLAPRSLASRVILFSTVWAVAALAVIATVISTLYRNSSVQNFESLLSAHLFNLIGAVEIDADGRLAGNPQLGDIRYSIPGSGWYWSVEPLGEKPEGQLRSLSMVRSITGPSVIQTPFDAEYRRKYSMQGLSGERIEVLESEYVLDANNQAVRFRMMGNLSELGMEIWQFNRKLYLYLALFGIGMIAINAVAILFGLRPLDRVRQALARIRRGEVSKLDGDFPVEIAPLAAEMNALIDNNRRVLERSRTQVGNLAHSLKTPLAVLLNEGRAAKGASGRLIVEQAGAMQLQVQHYLQRARFAAQRDSVIFRTPVLPTLERMVRVARKLNPELAVVLEVSENKAVFAGEKEDLEEILGNLIENACNHARLEVVLRLATGSETGTSAFELLVEDDGPGIPDQQTSEVLKRGRRLDEKKAGSGLGLSIVADLVGEYGGALQLERSDIGGLKVCVRLPRAP